MNDTSRVTIYISIRHRVCNKRTGGSLSHGLQFRGCKERIDIRFIDLRSVCFGLSCGTDAEVLRIAYCAIPTKSVPL